jgi:exodeoxyribonuclease VII large subunit
LNDSPSKHILSISKLTEKLKQFIEERFSMVWITGEISNLRMPSSGHAYFTLKDDRSQIAAVMFRGQLRQLKFDLDDGIVIVGLGRISIYEPRGTYQIILEYIEPKSAGALQLAFEQLKAKLAREGLFDEDRKRKLPYLPRKICVITSIAGAVIHDMLHIIDRRFRGVGIEIVPVRVQGAGAENEIARAIALANRRARADVIILARGGGSLEDLCAFNSEGVARAIVSSSIPIVSAVGHETDYTISDFAADSRAPTPSAAAEMAVPVKNELRMRCAELRRRCLMNMERLIQLRRDAIAKLRRALVHPHRKVMELQQYTDEMAERLDRAVTMLLRQQKMGHKELHHKLFLLNPVININKYKVEVEHNSEKLLQNLNKLIAQQRRNLDVRHAALMALSPQAVLERGYSITRAQQDGKVVKQAEGISEGQGLEVILFKGKLNVIVHSTEQ